MPRADGAGGDRRRDRGKDIATGGDGVRTDGALVQLHPHAERAAPRAGTMRMHSSCTGGSRHADRGSDQVYGLDVSDIRHGNLAQILGRLEEHVQGHP